MRLIKKYKTYNFLIENLNFIDNFKENDLMRLVDDLSELLNISMKNALNIIIEGIYKIIGHDNIKPEWLDIIDSVKNNIERYSKYRNQRQYIKH